MRILLALVAVNVSIGAAIYLLDDGPREIGYDDAFNTCLDFAQEGNDPYEAFRKYSDILWSHERTEERVIPASAEEDAMDGCVAGVMVIYPDHDMYWWERPW